MKAEGLARWKRVQCPQCHRTHEIHVMRLTLTCRCGKWYCDVEPHTGWYTSRAAFEAGQERIAA